MIGEILHACSAGILGIFLGAQICEGVLFVPYWKSMQPKDFFEMHKIFGKKIYQFFAPLTIVATLIPVNTAVNAMLNMTNGFIFSLLMGIFTLVFFSTFYLYFKKANKSFAEGNLSDAALAIELNRWGNWHWGRIVFEFLAFICSLLVLTAY